jgi:glycosyltransferase involved in cell wall biosynthesis/predicted O-methyltransferase YrrM
VCGDASAPAAQFEHSIQLWRASGGPLLLDDDIEPGPWFTRLATALAAAPAEPVSPTTVHSPAWRMRITDNQEPVLCPVPEPPGAGGVHTVVFPGLECDVSSKLFLHWRRRYVKRMWFFENDHWRVVDPAAALVRRVFHGQVVRRVRSVMPGLAARLEKVEAGMLQQVMALQRRPGLAEEHLPLNGESETKPWLDWIENDNQRVLGGEPAPAGRPLRILQYAASLKAGGTERQLANLAIGLFRREVDVCVRTLHDTFDQSDYFGRILREAGISAGPGGQKLSARGWPTGLTGDLLTRVPARLRQHVLALYHELRQWQPDILQCWDDQPNVAGALAGLLAGVPRILLCTRSVHPDNFPAKSHPVLKRCYQILARSERVHFLANSRAGAENYAAWLDISFKRFHVVANGVCLDGPAVRTPENCRAARRVFGLTPRARVVCGIFRLDDEKRPIDFLRVVEAVRRHVPELVVLLAGGGSQENHVREEVYRRHMDGYVRVLGHRDDPERVLLASDVALLTSSFEGCPNAVIEAQYLGVPVVATRGGGTADCLVEGETGFLAAVGDVERLAECLTRVLTDNDLRDRMSERARTFAAREFALDDVVESNVLVYHRAFEPVASGMRVITPWFARCASAEARAAMPSARSGKTEMVACPGTPAAVMFPPDAVGTPPEFTEVETRQIEAVEGHFHAFDAQAVHRMARLARGPIVEVGSFLGKSTVAILLGARKSGQPVTAIDPWYASNPDELGYEHTRLQGTNDFLTFAGNVLPHRQGLQVICRRGRDVQWVGREPIGGLFIDAIHTYDEVRADYEHYLPWLAPDGLLCFHDFSPEYAVFPGVRRFIEEELLTTGFWRWDDFRGAVITLRRVRRPRRSVVEHNQRLLRAARAKVIEIAAQQKIARPAA